MGRAAAPAAGTARGGPRAFPEAWFLGPKAENLELLRSLVNAALDSHADFRRSYFPDDPTHITDAVQQSPGYQAGVENLRRQTALLLDKLQLSAPFASLRYHGHMLWDQALPATVGLIAGLLYNQNNVAAEASPVTTRLEIEVGEDLCRMLGYAVPPDGTVPAPGTIVPWGHITSGGTVANIEALWAARNLKYAGVALRAALREVPALAPARGLLVALPCGSTARLHELDTWTLLNLDIDVLAGLPAGVAALGVEPQVLADALTGYAVQHIGLIDFYRSFMPDVLEPPVLLAPATSHYSWPKAATLIGLGQNAVLVQRVDRDARLDLDAVETTLDTLARRRTPVLCVVAVMGSTEESAVDPLSGLLAMRERFRARGLNFAVHADAGLGRLLPRHAAGGRRGPARRPGAHPGHEQLCPGTVLRAEPGRQHHHRPAQGRLRAVSGRRPVLPQRAMRDAVSLKAPVVFHSQAEPTVGVYGVEGSKPGSAAASVWLAHRVIRPDRSGYGRILGSACGRPSGCSAAWRRWRTPRFTITMFNMTPAERAGARAEDLAVEHGLIREFVNLDNQALSERLDRDTAARNLFNAIGSDQVILAFSLNPTMPGGVPNTDLARANALNDRVFSYCSVIEPQRDASAVELILTSSRFDPKVYGHGFVDDYCRRMGVAPEAALGVDFLICTSMDPWTTETSGGDFLVTVEAALRRAAHRALDELGFDL